MSGATVADLRASVSCDVLEPEHTAYHEARVTFNAMIDRQPAVIVMARTTADVSAAVRWAASAGLPIAVRGGGHSVAGHAVAEGAVVIDLREMHDVSVDPARRRVRVGGGTLWEDVDRAAFPLGLAMTGGTFGDTGVGGLTLGGGLGFLMGTGGLTCDLLIRAEVVTGDGSVVIAGAVAEGGDPDLLWALRGGGGNFGVVTEFEFALQPVGPIWGGDILFPLESAGAAMQAVARLAHTVPDELVFFAGGPRPLIEEGETEPREGAPLCFAITPIYQGTEEQGLPHVQPLLALPHLRHVLKPMTYLEAQEKSGRLPFGLRHYWKGHFLRELDDTAIKSITRAMGSATGLAFVLLEAITGVARTEPAGGAAFGQRSARWNVSGLAIWEDVGLDELHLGWARDFADALRPSSLTGAGYANYAPVDETPDRVRAAFGPETYSRLGRVKRRYDPDNRFRFNLNIPPGAA